MLTNIIAIAVISLIIGGATVYLIKAKKRGVRCIGCPDGHVCQAKNKASGACGGCQACHNCSDSKE